MLVFFPCYADCFPYIDCDNERYELRKCFYKNFQKNKDKEKLEGKAAYCKEQILKAKNDHIQKQPSRGVHSKSCSENMQQIYRRTPMSKCDFNKIAKQLY